MTANVFLRQVFCVCVTLLAIWRFSENTADPDLWGHVLFGQRMIHLGHLEKTEPFSWTAPDYPWINHEVGAELIMGATHMALGGPGLLLLALATGLMTFLLALRMGNEGLHWPERGVTWAVAALAAKEIAFGFSVRPQIFSAVALITLFWLLRKAHTGNAGWLLVIPVLFVLWINIHGAALAGVCLLIAASCSTTLQFLSRRFIRKEHFTFFETNSRVVGLLWWVTLLSLMGLCFNPWKAELVKWLIGSVSWFRPEISEWNPPTIGVAHAGMFALIPISAFAFIFSRRKRWLWEIAMVAALAFICLRHARHIPLFAIAVLAFVPPHLADALARFKGSFENLKVLFERSTAQRVLAFILSLASLAIASATITYGKEKFYTIEVPRDEYPNAAIDFIRKYEIKGNMISFFDWGEQCLWELPESRVSIDGRLDTCYPRDLLHEHWNFYDGKPVDGNIFNINKADFALLRTDVVGSSVLEKYPSWTLVYRDPLSVVFVRERNRFPKLQNLQIPVGNSRQALIPRDTFPKTLSQNALAK